MFFSIKSFSKNLTWEKSSHNKVHIYTYEDVHYDTNLNLKIDPPHMLISRKFV